MGYLCRFENRVRVFKVFDEADLVTKLQQSWVRSLHEISFFLVLLSRK